MVEGVRFSWVKTPPYEGNGAGRVKNMLSFAARIWRSKPTSELPAPDLVLGSTPHPFAALAAERVARRHRVPFVLEVRDLWPDSLVKVGGASPNHPLVRVLGWLERHLYASAHSIVTLLPNAAGHIVARGGKAERIVWVPNGVDFSIAPAATPRAPDAPFTVVYAGSHGRANAIDSMVDAARALAGQSHPPVRFRFIGEGPERDRLKQAVADERLASVSFDGPVPKEQIYRELQEADVLLATTRNIDLYEHGLSFNKLFDYLAAGRPIVFGAACPGNPVEEANAGMIVPPEDSDAMATAIRQLAVMTPDQRWEIGLRGRRFAEDNYDIRKLAVRLEDAMLLAARVRGATHA